MIISPQDPNVRDAAALLDLNKNMHPPFPLSGRVQIGHLSVSAESPKLIKYIYLRATAKEVHL